MEINLISSKDLKVDSLSYSKYKNKKNLLQKNEVPTIRNQRAYFNHLGFKGCTKPLVPLINDYKWFVRHDQKEPILAFLSLEAPKENMEALANIILADEKMSFNFIRSLTKHPRKIKRYYRKLQEKLPHDSVFFNLYAPNNKYKIAYENYIETRVQNAKHVSDLLKIRPDWKEEFLIQKHKELYNNDNFELGQVPHCIGPENFSPIIDYLKKYMDYGFKVKQDIPDLVINDKIFKFEKIIDGRSDKNVFKITTPTNHNFIIKVADPSQKGLNKPFAIGTCCIIDQYLTRNNCRNSAPLRYYNHDNNVAIYDYIEHETTTKMHSLGEFVTAMPDFADLGLRHSDTVGNNNYFKLNNVQKVMKKTFDFEYGVEHKELISVDNDHVTYNQLLSPMVDKYHKYLPSGMQMFH